jgi:flagellar motor switch/type III secretory pathway protein FliN
MASLPVAAVAKKEEFPEELWEQAEVIPCVLSVDVRLRTFSVRDLLRIEPGSIVESKNLNGADVPVFVNARLIGWAEFEVVGQRLAVRLTELI